MLNEVKFVRNHSASTNLTLELINLVLSSASRKVAMLFSLSYCSFNERLLVNDDYDKQQYA